MSNTSNLSQTHFNLAHAFSQHAEDNPDRTALYLNDNDITYGELASLAKCIAAWLQHETGGNPERVGVLGSRSLESYAGIIGTCWTGAAYVPLNPAHPPSRLANMISRARLDALIVDATGQQSLTREVLDVCPDSILAPESDNDRLQGHDALNRYAPTIAPVMMPLTGLPTLFLLPALLANPRE